MGFISPQQLNDDPKLWLSVPHELHKSLMKLMEGLIFPGFKQKLIGEHIHCFECEGAKPFKVVTKDTFEDKMCTGFIGKGKDVLLRLTDIKE